MGPLKGVRIVEFDGLGPVPLCAMLLADLGAEIVRITRQGKAQEQFEDVGGAILHRSRPQLALDLRSEEGRKAALAAIERADALIEGFRPGVMERLGLGPDVCLARNPRLVYGRMTGWGQTGPLAKRAGHDINYIGLTGALHAIGTPDAPPPPPLNLVGDNGGGAMLLAVGILSGLLEARSSKRGQVVDSAMTEGSALLMSLFYGLRAGGNWSDERGANLLDGGRPYYRCYACADGRYIAVGALEGPFFQNLLKGLGIPSETYRQNDPAGWPAMERHFAEIFKTRSRDDWAAHFAGIDACVTPVLSLGEAPQHAHNLARSTFIEKDGVVQPAPAPRFSRTQPEIAKPATEATTLADLLARWTKR